MAQCHAPCDYYLGNGRYCGVTCVLEGGLHLNVHRCSEHRDK